jgi:4-amino-4-deoxy-L-arabinose transferase-like glycosyltransferase
VPGIPLASRSDLTGGRDRARRALLLLILAALLARVVYLQQVSALPFFHDPVGDSAGSLARARGILAGEYLPAAPYFYGGILYPWILAGFALLFGANLYPVCLVQALLGCALVWAVYRFAVRAAPSRRRRRGRRAGLAAAGLTALYGPFAFLEADILMVSWTLLALALAGGTLLKARRRASRGQGVAVAASIVGLLLGLAATERPNLVALIPAAAIWMAWETWRLPSLRRGKTARLSGPAALFAAAACVIAPVAWTNHAVSGRWVLLTTSGGINFAIGNHEGATGTFDEPWQAEDAHAAARETDLQEASLRRARAGSGRTLDPVEASAWWWSQGWLWIASQPAAAASLTLRKAALFWNGQELPNHLHFDFMREVAPALRLMPLTFGWVAPFGLAGLLSPAARRRIDPSACRLLAVLVLLPMLTVLPFFVADRYRVVVVPALLASAGWSIERLAAGLRRPAGGSRRRAAIGAGALLVSGLFLSIPLVESDRARDHWMLAQAWKKQGRFEESVASYLRAVSLSPGDAVLRNNLGLSLALAGRAREAEREYRRALDLDPQLAFPAKNLGLLLLRQGRAEEARVWLEKALARDPLDPEAARALAAIAAAPSPP